jgi:hypothetical protein
MSHSNMTRWIEDAEARRFNKAAMFARGNVRESRYLHLGETIAKVPSWFRHGIGRTAPTTGSGAPSDLECSTPPPA